MIITTKLLAPRKRRDWYPTHRRDVRLALGMLPPWLNPTRILDPGAGTGVWGDVARERWPQARIVGAELSTEPPTAAYDAWRHGDFLTMPFYERFDLVIGNPPYNIAEDMIRRSLDLIADGDFCVQLLRLGFLESLSRAKGLFREHPPLKVGVYAKRPSFQEDQRTDATAYAAFCWMKGYTGKPQVEWLIDDSAWTAKDLQVAMDFELIAA